jgi:hypothetical protein
MAYAKTSEEKILKNIEQSMINITADAFMYEDSLPLPPVWAKRAPYLKLSLIGIPQPIKQGRDILAYKISFEFKQFEPKILALPINYI